MFTVLKSAVAGRLELKFANLELAHDQAFCVDSLVLTHPEIASYLKAGYLKIHGETINVSGASKVLRGTDLKVRSAKELQTQTKQTSFDQLKFSNDLVRNITPVVSDILEKRLRNLEEKIDSLQGILNKILLSLGSPRKDFAITETKLPILTEVPIFVSQSTIEQGEHKVDVEKTKVEDTMDSAKLKTMISQGGR